MLCYVNNNSFLIFSFYFYSLQILIVKCTQNIKIGLIILKAMTKYKFSFSPLYFFVFLLYSNDQVQAAVPGLFFDRVTLSSQGANRRYYNGSTFPGLVNSITRFTFQWRTTVPQIVKGGLCLHIYKMQGPNQYYSYVVEMQNTTTSKTDIYLQTFSASPWVLYLTFSVILITVESNSIEFITYSDSFSILSNPSRSQSSQLFTATSSKYTFQSTRPEIKVICALQWIKFNYLAKSNQNFQAICAPLYTYQLVQLLFNAWAGTQNSLNSFKMNILVINCGDFLPNLATFQFSIYYVNIYPSIPDIFGLPAKDYNCIHYIFNIARFMNDTGYLQFSISTTQVITGIRGPPDFYALETFCITSCPANHFTDYSTNSTECVLCNSAIINCINCRSKDICTLCKPVSALVNQKCTICSQLIQHCVSCSNSTHCLKCFLGFAVTGGCTTVVGCTLVVKIPSGNTMNSVCQSCNQSFFNYNSTDHKCYCKVGWLAGDYCTTIFGCLSTQMIGNTVVCTSCNFVDHFQLQNQTCACISGYQLKNGACVDTCGDGLVFTSQCDDGNRFDGDGCSSQCKTQFLYKCTNNAMLPSQCYYIGLKLNITLTSIQKIEGQNQAIFSFSFDPNVVNLKKTNLINNFFFSCQNANYSVEKWVYDNGRADVYVNYITDLEGKNAKVNFTFKDTYVNHIPIQVQFTINSIKGKILYYYFDSIQTKLSFLLMSFSVVGIFLVVFCSWLHKMVGVEFLFTTQIIYYAHFGISNYDTSARLLQYLGLSSLNYRANNFSLVNFTTNPSFQILQFSSQWADMSLLMLVIIVTIPLLIILILYFFENRLKDIWICRKLIEKNIVFTQVVSPILLSYTFPLFFICSTYFLRNNTTSNPLLSTFARNAIFLYLSGLYSFSFHLYFLKLTLFSFLTTKVNYFVKQSRDCYLLIFQVLMVGSFGLCCFWLKKNSSICLLGLIVVIGTALLWQLFFKPYKNLIDNIGIDLNVAVILVYLFLIFLQNNKIVYQNQANNLLLLFATISGLVICCLFSIIRVVIAIIRKIQNRSKNSKKAEVTQKQIQPQISTQKQKQGQTQDYEKCDMERQERAVVTDISQKLIPIQRYEAIQKEDISKKLDQQYIVMISRYREQFRKKSISGILYRK